MLPVIKKDFINEVLESRRFGTVYDFQKDFVDGPKFLLMFVAFVIYLWENQEKFNFAFNVKFECESPEDRLRLLQFMNYTKSYTNGDLYDRWLSRNELLDRIKHQMILNAPESLRAKIKFASINDNDEAVFSESGVIEYRSITVNLLKNSKEYFFCKAIYNKQKNEFHSWDEIVEDMGIIDGTRSDLTKKDFKLIRSKIVGYIRAINKKALRSGLPKLVEMKGHEIRRLY